MNIVNRSEAVGGFLAHYGVKGMRWGVRRDRTPVKVQTVVRPGKKVRASGGKYQKANPDAVRVAVIKQKAAKSSTDSLSNKELQELINRMNLERQYSSLTGRDMGLGQKIGRTIVGDVADHNATKIGAVTAAKIFGLTGNVPLTVVGAGAAATATKITAATIRPKSDKKKK